LNTEVTDTLRTALTVKEPLTRVMRRLMQDRKDAAAFSAIAAIQKKPAKEIRKRLRREKKLGVAVSSVWRFCDHHEITFKKSPPCV